MNVSAIVTHSGGMASDEVAQLYGVFQGVGAASAPLQQLLAFQRLRGIAPGDSLPVSFTVAREDFELVDAMGSLRVIPGMWKLFLGG